MKEKIVGVWTAITLALIIAVLFLLGAVCFGVVCDCYCGDSYASWGNFLVVRHL